MLFGSPPRVGTAAGQWHHGEYPKSCSQLGCRGPGSTSVSCRTHPNFSIGLDVDKLYNSPWMQLHLWPVTHQLGHHLPISRLILSISHRAGCQWRLADFRLRICRSGAGGLLCCSHGCRLVPCWLATFARIAGAPITSYSAPIPAYCYNNTNNCCPGALIQIA